MNKSDHEQLISQKIEDLLQVFLPHGAGQMTAVRLKSALEQVAQVAFTQGEHYALISLLTVEDVAREFGISEQRVRAIAQEKHDRFYVGRKVGRNMWLFRPEELEALRPAPKAGRPKKGQGTRP